MLIRAAGEHTVIGVTRTFAVLIEECDRFDGRKWWMATLFRRDPASGLGVMEGP